MSTETPSDVSAPTRYEIQKLLDEAIQPWDALTEQELDALSKGIGRTSDPLAVPVVLSKDGRVVDGTQRLRALQMLGRKYIPAYDVRVLPQVSHGNALEWSIRLNAQRRQLDIPQKARVVRMLMAKNGWSQGRCAKVFGVSPAAVSQWLGQVPADPDVPEPDAVVGADGVVQDVSAKRREQRARLNREAQPHTWSAHGECFQLVRKATGRMRGAIDVPDLIAGLSIEERDATCAILQDLAATATELLNALTDRGPAPREAHKPIVGVGLGLRGALASLSSELANVDVGTAATEEEASQVRKRQYPPGAEATILTNMGGPAPYQGHIRLVNGSKVKRLWVGPFRASVAAAKADAEAELATGPRKKGSRHLADA